VTEAYEVEVTDMAPVYPTTTDRITLITCDTGSYNASTGNYNKRLIVVAERRS
jgi:sortase (surface protein transpeptidase)